MFEVIGGVEGTGNVHDSRVKISFGNFQLVREVIDY